jgi:Protein of unknown function (DUF2911)
MKKILLPLFTFACMLFALSSKAQKDKTKRPSPPAVATATISNGAVVSINYSQPSVKGRTIGKNLEPKDGEVWRTGANEATVFETSAALKIDGKELPAGKYSLFSKTEKGNWTFMINKTWDQWGAYDYKIADDVLSFNAKEEKATTFAEKLTFDITKEGKVTLLWGDKMVSFQLN